MNLLVTIIAKYFIVIPIAFIIILFFRLKGHQKRLEFIACLIAGGILSLLLAKLGGMFINDPRPFVVGHFRPLIPHAADNGFPSDHTLLASFISWFVFHYSKKLGLVSLSLALLIGLARVYAGVHHIEDIVGSFVITVIAMIFVFALATLLEKKSKSTIKHWSV